jgi:hypothetical protein
MNRVRIGLALLGFVTAVLGVALDDNRLVWFAMGLLGASFVLRLVVRRRSDGSS